MRSHEASAITKGPVRSRRGLLRGRRECETGHLSTNGTVGPPGFAGIARGVSTFGMERSKPGRDSAREGIDMKTAVRSSLLPWAALPTSALAAGERLNLSSCGNVTGASWVFPNTGGKVKGNASA